MHLVRAPNYATITISSIWNLITMGKTDFFHRGQNYLIYTSKYLQNIGDFGEKSGTKFSTAYLWSFVTAMNPQLMALYLASNSIHTPEVQYGLYTALGIMLTCSN